MRRRTSIFAVLSLVALSAGLGWLGSTQIQSPAEVALSTAAPEASAILAPAEARVLSTDIVTRGTGRFGLPQRIALAVSTLKPTPGRVTDVPASGTLLDDGDVLLTASGRPTFVLQGATPMFRDLGPGDSGPDVQQLEEALTRLGFDPGDVDGRFDDRTSTAVASWYEASGFVPFGATADQLARIDQLELDLLAAELDRLGAQDASVSARAATVAAEAEAAAAARAAGLAAGSAGVGVASAQAELNSVLANAEITQLSGTQQVAQAQALLAAAPDAIAAAAAAAAAANAVAESDVTAREAELGALLAGGPDGPAAIAAAISAAEAELAAAQADAATIRLASAESVAAAQSAAEAAPGALLQARADAEAANLLAEAELRQARDNLSELAESGEATAAQRLAAIATKDVAELRRDQLSAQGERAVAAARRAIERSVAALVSAEAAAAAVIASADQAVLAKRTALDAVITGSPAGIPAAEASLASARSVAAETRLQGERAVAIALLELDGAALSLAHASALADAQNDLLLPEIAQRQAALHAAFAGAPDALPFVSMVDAAAALERNALIAIEAREEIVDRIGERLAEARARAAVQVPADELVFVATTPVRVSEVVVLRGDPAEGGVMTVTDSKISIDSSLALDELAFVQSGLAVRIDEPSLGINAEGVVLRVAESPGTNGVDGFHVYFEIAVENAPALLVGASVRLSIAIESTGDTVLAVPIGALTLAPDGSSRVQVQRGDQVTFVTVEPGLSADGFVEVRPVDGELVAGDLVVIGFEARGLGTAGQS